MSALVAMLIICWIPQPNGTLKEAWRIEGQVTAETCLTMSDLFSGAGEAQVITVRCEAHLLVEG